MISQLTTIDRNIFLFINHLPHNPFLNYFFAFLAGISYGGFIWFAIAVTVFVWEEIKDKKSLFAQVLAGLLTFILVELLLKNIFGRLRPEFSIPSTIVILDFTNSLSFPSGHAAMAFAGAYILSRKHRKWGLLYYVLAFLISFSRIYLGKHYPSDVVAGMMIGTLIGYISVKISEYVFPKKVT